MLKAFADNKININKKLKFDLERIENILGKGENAGYQHFLLFPQCFQKFSFSGLLKSGLCGKELMSSVSNLINMCSLAVCITLFCYLHETIQ